MCGICGIYDTYQRNRIDKEILQRMCDVLAHRGPDDEGIFVDKNIGLGHRRLSIIDLAGGHQPIHNEDNSIWIVFNGEIYNHCELRDKLESRGHRYYTLSDTESIIHAYEEWKDDCVKELRGMFAFGIWDSKKKKLLLARDRLGVKPVYYIFKNGRLVFASEIKSILQDKNITREVNPKALNNYLTLQYVPATETMFKEINKLLPGYILIATIGEIKIKRYWDSKLSEGELGKNEDYYSQRLLELLKESVKLRLISDVPLGAFLSGGIDSGTIVGLMSELMNQPVKTFSIGFDVRNGKEAEDYNELKYARIISKYFQTEHHEEIVSSKDIYQYLPKVVWHCDEPLSDYANIPTYLISQLARRYVTVVLTGEGADELFGGYPRYLREQLIHWYQKIPHPLRKGIIDSLVEKVHGWSKAKKLVESASIPLKMRYTPTYIFGAKQKQNLYTEDFKKEIGQIEFIDVFNPYFGDDSQDYLNAIFYVDIKTWLPDDLLMKVDKMSMMTSLEAREPYLDHKIVEFCNNIPGNLKIKGMTLKYILKKAVANLLPKEIINRKKHGFTLPIKIWFRNELKELSKILVDSVAQKRGYFNIECVHQMLKEHQSGVADHSLRLWTLLTLELWFRIYIDNKDLYKPELSLI